MTTLVTGATGLIGRCLVRHLVEAGEPTRALTRDPARAAFPPGVDVHAGDLTAPDSLTGALRGADRVFLIAVPETAAEVVARARRAGVTRVVVLSAGAVTFGMDTAFHLPVERAVEASGLEWTHVRPGEFAYNKVTLWAPSIRAERTVHFPGGDRPQISPVHEDDVAAVAATALLRDGHAGEAYTFTGPGRRTLREQSQDIGDALGEAVAFDEVSREQAVEILRRRSAQAAAMAEVVLGLKVLYARPSGGTGEAGPGDKPAAPFRPEPMPEAIELVTGRPARTFREWADDRAADFR